MLTPSNLSLEFLTSNIMIYTHAYYASIQRVLTWLHSLYKFQGFMDDPSWQDRSRTPQTLSHFPLSTSESSFFIRYPSASVYSGPDYLEICHAQHPLKMTYEAPLWDLYSRQYCKRELNPIGTLPHPEYNPLITVSPEVIAEEYCRVLQLRNDFQLEQEAFGQWQYRNPMTFNITNAVQMANDAAQYIVDYAIERGLQKIDFIALSLHYFRPTTQYTNIHSVQLACLTPRSGYYDSNTIDEWLPLELPEGSDDFDFTVTERKSWKESKPRYAGVRHSLYNLL